MEPDINSIENSVDPDQLASEEASWSESTLLYPQHVSSSKLQCIKYVTWGVQDM